MSGDPYIKENERLEAEIARLQKYADAYFEETIALNEENKKLRAGLEAIVRGPWELEEARHIARKALAK